MSILETKDLKKVYGTGETAVHALRGVNFQVEKGEFAAIVGTSGSGKSTLLHMLGGLDRTIFRRRKIGFIFQNYNLVPVLNVYENIVLPIQLDGNEPDKRYVDQIIETLGIDSKLNNLPNNLSGGHEPTGNLDSRTSQDVMGLLKITSQKFCQTIVMITHNEEIAQLSDRIIRIEDGSILGGEVS